VVAAVSAYRFLANVAVIVRAAVTVTVQSPVPRHSAALQPLNSEPVAGVARRVTSVLSS
jgi:hypothetical protein